MRRLTRLAQQDERGAGPRSADRSHLPGQRIRAAALRPGAMAGRRHRLHDRRARAEPPAARDIVRYDAATGARSVLIVQHAADARRRASKPLDDRRLRLVGRRREAADLHQHAEGVAPEHARRLLGARTSRAAASSKLGASAPAVVADVREVLAGRARASATCAATTSTSSGSTTARHAADDRRIGDDHQRHVGLGLRRGVRRARRLPLEPRRHVDRLLAVRQHRRRHLLADQQHRLALSDDHEDSVSEGRHDQLRRARRRGQRRRRRDDVDQDRGRSARHLPGAHRRGSIRTRCRSSS